MPFLRLRRDLGHIPAPRIVTELLTAQLKDDVRQLFDTSGTPNLTLTVGVNDCHDGNVQFHTEGLQLGCDLV